MAGLDRIVQDDFSAGMVRATARERIPANALWDIVNGLVDEYGSIYRRGGSSYLSTATFGSPMFIWDGWLASGQTTVLANTDDFGKLNADGSITNLGGSGLARPSRAAAMDGTLYLPGGATYDGTTVAAAAKTAQFYAVVANRLLAAAGDRIDFSGIGTPGTFAATDFHQVPGGVDILGIEGLRDAAAVFTTDGVWLIRNMAFNLTDTDGNVQQSVDQYSRDLVLWGNAGIAGWSGGLVVPGRDGVWLMSLGVASEAGAPFVRISDAITSLYQDHVRLGRFPGLATVYRNHYLLPILDSDGPVDFLVCNLAASNSRGQRTYPWSRLTGFGAEVSAVASRQTSAGPQLLGASSAGRILKLSFFEPGVASAAEADGTAHAWEITTRDAPTGQLNLNTVLKFRVTYELSAGEDGVPALHAFFVTGQPLSGGSEWGLFDWGAADWTSSETAEALEGDAPVDDQASTPFSWPVRRRTRYARFRLSCADPAARLAVKTLETFIRSSGRI